MSRFPLFPLLLSFSTTLQSACLQDKCTLPEFENNDECKLATSDMSVFPDQSMPPDGDAGIKPSLMFGTKTQYQITTDGPEKIVDSIATIGTIENINGITINGKIAIVMSNRKFTIPDIIDILRVDELDAKIVKESSMKLYSVRGAVDQINSLSVNRLGVGFFAKGIANNTAPGYYFLPWFSTNPHQLLSSSMESPTFSLSSDEKYQTHAAITSKIVKVNGIEMLVFQLLASKNPVFVTDNLIVEAQSYMNRGRVLVGNLDSNREPELITWDVNGLNALIFKYIDKKYQKTKSPAANLPEIQCSPRICPVALGDLNQDGLSDLIVLTGSYLNIYYGTGNIAAPFLMPAQNILAGQDVQAIAVSIPSGDDPPKLVWATSTFVPTAKDSPTGMNTITINVLPIMK